MKLRALLVVFGFLSLSGVDEAPACDSNTGSISVVPSLGGVGDQVTALNNAGQVVGFGYTPSGTLAGYLAEEDSVVELGPDVYPFAINDLGVVMGEVEVYDWFFSETHAFVYADGELTDIGTLGGAFSSAVAVNASGQLTGSATGEWEAGPYAFLWDGDSLISLGTLGGSKSHGSAINEAGEIVGVSLTEGGQWRAFLWDGRDMQDLGTLGGDYSAAVAINRQGAVAGESATASGWLHAFLFSDGVMIDLGALSGTWSVTQDLNDANQVIGQFTTAQGQNRGFIFTQGVVVDLGTLGGDTMEPWDLNNVGQVVGTSTTESGVYRAVLWQNGVLVDLNSLLPADSGWELTSARFINDSGLIVGYGIYGGADRWFRLQLGSANQAPVAVIAPVASVECSGPVTLDGTASSDPDGDELTYEWIGAGQVFCQEPFYSGALPVGTTEVTLRVTDPCGASDEVSIEIEAGDLTPPVIHSASVAPDVLNSPNQKLVPVTCQVSASDACDPNPVARIVSIEANEPVGAGDIQITGDLQALLSASRNPAGTGRVYTIVICVEDSAGNKALTTVTVSVPKGNLLKLETSRLKTPRKSGMRK